MRYVFFLSAEKRFKGVKTTPKVCTQKSFFFLNISILFYFWSGHCTKAVEGAKPVNEEI